MVSSIGSVWALLALHGAMAAPAGFFGAAMGDYGGFLRGNVAMDIQNDIRLLSERAPDCQGYPDPAKRESYLYDYLFPISSDVSTRFTTCTALDPHLPLQAVLPVSSGSFPYIAPSPDGHTSLYAFYPAGSINPKNQNTPPGGFAFYSPGPDVDALREAKEITFGYSVYFEDGFDWQLGGKLPGVYGGTSEKAAKGCTGGRQQGRDECFSLRLMWRSDGNGELYTYLPTSATQPNSYNTYPPRTILSHAFGDSVGRGSFNLTAGTWNTVTQRIRLNDVGREDGELQLLLNGKSVISLSGLTLRVQEDAVFQGIIAQTFFGGSSEEWASPKDQSGWFKDFSLAVIDWW